jgi:hypothetical protein
LAVGFAVGGSGLEFNYKGPALFILSSDVDKASGDVPFLPSVRDLQSLLNLVDIVIVPKRLLEVTT